MAASASAIALVQEGIFMDVNDAWLAQFKVKDKDDLIGMPVMDNFETESQAALKGALVATIAGKWQRRREADRQGAHRFGRCRRTAPRVRKVDLDDGTCVQIRIAPQLEGRRGADQAGPRRAEARPDDAVLPSRPVPRAPDQAPATQAAVGTHCLVYIKPDNFGEIHDKVGIIESEEILAQLAEEVRKRMHPRDVAGRFEGTVHHGPARARQTRAMRRSGQAAHRSHEDTITFDVGGQVQRT